MTSPASVITPWSQPQRPPSRARVAAHPASHAVVLPWAQQRARAGVLQLDAYVPSDLAGRVALWDDALRKAGAGSLSPAQMQGLLAVAAFRDFGRVIVNTDGTVTIGPQTLSTKAPAGNINLQILETFFPLPVVAPGPCDPTVGYVAVDGPGNLCVFRAANIEDGAKLLMDFVINSATGVAEMLSEGDAGKAAEWLLSNYPIFQGDKITETTWKETAQALVNLATQIAPLLQNPSAPALQITSYKPSVFSLPQGGGTDQPTGGTDQPGGGGGVEITMLPQDDNKRIQTAAFVLHTWLSVKGLPAWLTGRDEKAISTAQQGILLTSWAFSQFGRFTTQTKTDAGVQTSTLETNNWFLLADPNVSEADCPLKGVWDTMRKGCVLSFSKLVDGLSFSMASLAMDAAKPVQEALVSGDLGKLAAALIDTGYVSVPHPTQADWKNVTSMLAAANTKVATEMAGTSLWTESAWKPSYPEGGDAPPVAGETPPPAKTNWIMWGLGAVVVVGGVYLAMKASKASVSGVAGEEPDTVREDGVATMRVSNPTHDQDVASRGIAMALDGLPKGTPFEINVEEEGFDGRHKIVLRARGNVIRSYPGFSEQEAIEVAKVFGARSTR